MKQEESEQENGEGCLKPVGGLEDGNRVGRVDEASADGGVLRGAQPLNQEHDGDGGGGIEDGADRQGGVDLPGGQGRGA